MSLTGIYLIPDEKIPSSLQAVEDRLLTKYNPTPLPRWGLEHRLYRSTPSSGTEQAEPRFQHIITLSHHLRKTYAYISGANVVAIPSAQSNTLNALISTKMALMWTFKGGVVVSQGLAYEVQPGVTVQLGDVRAVGQQNQLRGVIVCIQVPNVTSPGEKAMPNGKDSTSEDAATKSLSPQDRIRELWKSFGVENAREYMSEQALDTESNSTEGIKEWCDALRLRG